MKNYKLFFLLVSLAFMPQVILADQPWKLVKHSDGIKVYSKMEDNSLIKTVKAETELKTTLSALFYLLTDVDNQPNWVYNCKKAEILKYEDNLHWYYYTQIDAPWPVTDRDAVTYVETKQDPASKTIIMKSVAVPDFIPESPEYVRIPELVSYWIFEPLANGKIRVTLKLKINLGGIIPQWVTNLLVSRGPFNTMKNFLFEIEKPKYKDVSLNFIEEPVY